MSKKTKKTHIVCTKCEKRKSVREYYRSSNPLFNDYAPVCKECIYKAVENEDEHKAFEAFQAVLKLVDKPLLSNIFKGDFASYMQQIQSLPHLRTKTYEDSDVFEAAKSLIPKQEVKLKELTEEELEAAQDFWGKGYNEEEYLFLIREWLDYESMYTIDSKAMEVYVQEICKTQLEIHQARQKGDSVDRLIKTLNDLFSSANLKPVQETGANATEQETFGTFIKKVENERPIPEPLEEWADIDNIGKNIRTWFTGMMHKSLGIEYKFQEEFERELEENTVKPRGEVD